MSLNGILRKTLDFLVAVSRPVIVYDRIRRDFESIALLCRAQSIAVEIGVLRAWNRYPQRTRWFEMLFNILDDSIQFAFTFDEHCNPIEIAFEVIFIARSRWQFGQHIDKAVDRVDSRDTRFRFDRQLFDQWRLGVVCFGRAISSFDYTYCLLA